MTIAEIRAPGLASPLSTMSEAEFREFQRMIFAEAGIHMPASKRVMVAGRLAKRLKVLGLGSYGEYSQYLRRDPAEKQIAVDLLTTNETYFFREPRHFDFLRDHILPGHTRHKPFRLWSAACSSGEEPYTAAMVLADGLGATGWDILASDISTQVLDRARSGRYPMARAQKIPRDCLRRHCLKGIGEADGTFMVDSALRSRVNFQQINLNTRLPEVGMFDVIFLRNVMIYFNAETKKQIVARLQAQLKPGGYFIVGHSETLNGLQEGLQAVMPSVYRASA
ncbi:protein-glutamate O-methyltransferase [Marinobacter nanhaiticus D15-8W]|uniref:Chemotaxis protein methyltransferase n=1 Tax=Marinobacter nanhaiticus D15-8W TaxID=626887 RepID=N6WUK9_9GAMM|nr:protein-glutamate O-methyltransferase CheR [Marinobacter nanhaiticus]ENO15211.1 protein-glutamate O-methyltransferase CheR [Marinobacter nanhaiticus D15-8W]BES69087.1 protein-glutamate O-methyltransferase [Marinobacter nanhaiticus D15-8W]